MTKEQEAQQAQTIARWRDKVNQPGTFLVPACEALEIVDSQAQKIAEQESKIKSMEENAGMLAGAFYDEKEALGIQIAEQAKEIERLRREISGLNYWKR